MSQVQPAAECLLGRGDFMNRRRATAPGVDIDPTIPQRRASDHAAMRNTLQRRALAASEQRFTGNPITEPGALS